MDCRPLHDAIYRIGRLSADPLVSSDALLTQLAQLIAQATDAHGVGIVVYEQGIDRPATICRTAGTWPEAQGSASPDAARSAAIAMVTDLPRERLSAMPDPVCDGEVVCERLYSDFHRPMRLADRAVAIFRRDDGSEMAITMSAATPGQPISRETLTKAAQLSAAIGSCWATVYRHEPAWMASLSPSSRRVLQNLLEGCDDDQIAERTGLTYHSVRAHLKRIFRDAGVRSRLHLIQTCRGGVRRLPVEPVTEHDALMPLVTVTTRRNGIYARTG